MDGISAPPVNATAISQAIAHATNYVVPSVDDIFAAGVPFDQVNQSQLFNGADFTPSTIFPMDFGGLYYNFSYLWPQLEKTGIILNTTEYCEPQVCSLLFGNFLYLPNIPANIFFAAIFGLAMLISIPVSIRYRTWGYMVGMILGLLCEVLGYVGRIMISQNDFTNNPFYIYIICLTIGPAFLSFSVYTCLARIVVTYGQNLSRFKPKTYTYIFAVCDFISLVLQGLGGGLAATSNNSSDSQRGVNVMIGGLAFQVFSLSIFIVLCADYALRIHRHRPEIDPTYYELRKSRRFSGFLSALTVATLTIFARSVFRVAELQQGFHSQFANNEVTFMVLEAGMITIASIALTAFHPGLVYGDQWRTVSSSMKHKKVEHKASEEKMLGNISTPSSGMGTENRYPFGNAV